MTLVDPDLELCRHLRDTAARIALSYADDPPPAWSKPDGDEVSEADLAVESALLEIISRSRPNDAVESEEVGLIGDPDARRRWIIDPIDGTTHFQAGRDTWGTHIALTLDGHLQLGMITRPRQNRSWWAMRDAGAWVETPTSRPQRLTVSGTRKMAQARIGGLIESGSGLPVLAGRIATWVLTQDSAVIDLLHGRIDAVLDDAGLAWDQAPAVLLVTEAGGRFRDPVGGQRWDLGWGCYTNAHLEEEFSCAVADLTRGTAC